MDIEIKKFLESIRIEAEKRELKDTQIILFGSQARGTAKITSDIDIAILTKDVLDIDGRCRFYDLMDECTDR